MVRRREFILGVWTDMFIAGYLLDLLLNPEDAGNTFFVNIRISPNYTASQTWYLILHIVAT
jgi:hypothetical protein